MQVIEYKAQMPVQMVFEADPQADDYVGTDDDWPFVVEFVDPMPVVWSTVVAEIIHHCRSCLDNAWFAVEPVRKYGFPYHPQYYRQRQRAASKARVREAFKALRAEKLSKQGHTLQVLAQLDNLNKHEMLTLCAMWSPEWSPMQLGELEADLIIQAPAPFAMTLAPGESFAHSVPFEVAFPKTRCTKGGEPVLELLGEMIEKTNRAFSLIASIPGVGS